MLSFDTNPKRKRGPPFLGRGPPSFGRHGFAAPSPCRGSERNTGSEYRTCGTGRRPPSLALRVGVCRPIEPLTPLHLFYQARKALSGRAVESHVGKPACFRRFTIDLDDSGPARSCKPDQASGRINDGAGPDPQEALTVARGIFGFRPDVLWQRLVEPDHVRSEQRATGFAVRHVIERLETAIADSIAARTADPAQTPMQSQDAAAPGGAMKAIHVLCDEREGSAGQLFFQRR